MRSCGCRSPESRCRGEAQVGAHRAAPREALRVFEGEHVDRGREGAHAGHLGEQGGLRIALLRHLLDLRVQRADLVAELRDDGKHGGKSGPQLSGDTGPGLAGEALGRAGGQAGTERLRDPASVADEAGSARTSALRLRIRARSAWVSALRCAGAQAAPGRDGQPAPGTRRRPDRLGVVGVDQAQLAGVGHDHLVPELREETAHPGRVGAGLEHDAKRDDAGEPAAQRLRPGGDACLLDELTGFDREHRPGCGDRRDQDPRSPAPPGCWW